MSHPLSLARRVSRTIAKAAIVSSMWSFATLRSFGVVPYTFEPDLPPLPAQPVVGQSLETIHSFHFNQETQSWDVVDTATIPQSSNPPVAGTSLRVVSYNVLSSPLYDVWTCELARWNHILDHVLPNANADIILLNEVSELFWQMSQERQWIRAGYFISDYHFNNGPRNNMIISRFPMEVLYRETVNPRRSLLAKVTPKPGMTLWVCCAHIHALYNGYMIRKHELDAMYRYIAETCKNDAVLIMGDLNFHNERENVNIEAPFYDVWRSLYPVPDPSAPWTEQQLGITYDTPNNPLTAPMGYTFPHRMRLDRALYKPAATSSEQVTFIPASMSVFAKDPISPLTPDLTPSDHYALQLDFNFGTAPKTN